MRKKIIDICLLIGIVLLMSPPVTNMKVHEWLGITVLVLMIVHQLLNRQYYKTLVKGKYNAYRKFLLSSNILLLIMCLLTMVSGMSISHHATPFFNGIIKGSLAHQLHLACSSWFLTLTGIHLGLNLNALVPLRKLKGKIRNVLTFIVACLAFYGLYVLVQSGMMDYLTLKAQMPYMDFTKTDTDLVLENVLPLIFWTFLGTQLARLFRKQLSRQHLCLLISAGILTAVCIFGVGLGAQKEQAPQNNDWGAMPTAQAVGSHAVSSAQPATTMNTTDTATKNTSAVPAADEEEETMNVKITIGDHVVRARLNNNEAARELWNKLPVTYPTMNLYGREMCYRMGAGSLPTKEAKDRSYKVGDISYWPPAGSLVILYKQNGEVFEQEPIGHTDDDLSFLNGMDDTNITWEKDN